MKLSLSDNLDLVDELIRKGDLLSARQKLKRLAPSQIPRDKYATLANLLRRCGLIDRGLRLLNEIVRSESKLIAATPEERLEYAMLLVRKGAIHEGRELLGTVPADTHPDVLLYEVFTLIPEWRYRETIPLLKQYIERIPERPLQQLVAKVNLVAASIYCGEHQLLSTLLPESIDMAKKYEYNFLLGSLYELGAQFEIARENYNAAEVYLDQAQTILGSSDSQESFYVSKWRTIAALLRHPDSLTAEKELRRLQKRAMYIGDYETVRDCEFHLLHFSKDQAAFEKLYCGSPNPDYRRRLVARYPHFQIPFSPYVWKLSGVVSTSRRFIDVQSGKTGDGHTFTEVGKAPHKLLLLLCRDFYRPQRLLQLATEIFEGEYVHPIHTPDKMHQIIARLREDLKAAKLPLRLISEGQTLRLEGIRNCVLVIDWAREVKTDSISLYMSQLSSLATRPFTTKEAARVWDCSVATASRRLQQATERSICFRIGERKQTKFQLLQYETAA